MLDDLVIRIFWAGPSSHKEACDKIGKGLYQVYQQHPLYGFTLVYIGMTRASYGARLHDWKEGADPDFKNACYYIGTVVPDSEQLELDRAIELSEALLIHTHAPAYNSTYIKDLNRSEEMRRLRVLNYGTPRLIQREVSGLFWAHPFPSSPEDLDL